MLVSCTELASHLKDPTWIVFDCRHDLTDHARGLRLYRDGHVPGARFAPVETALAGPKTGKNGRHPLPSPEAFARFLEQHGVTEESTLVAYDDAGGLYAARFWWMARWIGHTRTHLLDGGLTKWIADGFPLSTDDPVLQPAATPLNVKERRDDVSTTADILARLADSTHAVLDARAAERYRGEVEPIDPVAGHIPGALNRFYKANLNADGTFRAPDALRQDFVAQLGERAPQNVTHQCGSGITACANLFAMELAGLHGSKLYAGSWSEWVSDATRPVARG